MNNLSIALLAVAVIVIAAWLSGWLPGWLSGRLPASPLHEGFEAPPTAVDPMRPTEAETLAYLKYAVKLAVKPLDVTEINDFMDTISTPESKKTYPYTRALQARAYYREVHVPRLVSRNLVDHPFYKAVMASQSADELMKNVIAAKDLVTPRYSNHIDGMEALYDFMAAVNITPTDDERHKYKIDGNNLWRFFREDIFNPMPYAADAICRGSNPSSVFGADVDAVCYEAKDGLSIGLAYSRFAPLYKDSETIDSISDYTRRLIAYARSGHEDGRFGRVPPWYRPPKK